MRTEQRVVKINCRDGDKHNFLSGHQDRFSPIGTGWYLVKTEGNLDESDRPIFAVYERTIEEIDI